MSQRQWLCWPLPSPDRTICQKEHMSKLHELLAVETDISGQTKACMSDLKTTFGSKGHHFTKRVVTRKFMDPALSDHTEINLALQTTVGRELVWIGEKMQSLLDIGHQVDIGNNQATADVVLDDGTVLLKNMPTTSLLRLAHRLVELQDLITAIPTLDPAKNFTRDPTEGSDIHRAVDVEKLHGDKVFDYVVMVGPTERFPAQVKELMRDKTTSTTLTQEWSGLITVAQKGDMLDRVEDVKRAVKKARARANEVAVDVKQHVIGVSVLDHVFGDITKRASAAVVPA